MSDDCYQSKVVITKLMPQLQLVFSRHFWAFAKFGAVGTITAALYFFVMWASLSLFFLNYIVAVTLSYFVSNTFHFLANRHFTFNATGDRRKSQLLRYAVMWAVNYLITVTIVSICVEKFLFSPYVAVCVSVCFTVFTGYSIARYWVFKTED